jgi:hypothetical protein
MASSALDQREVRWASPAQTPRHQCQPREPCSAGATSISFRAFTVSDCAERGRIGQRRTRRLRSRAPSRVPRSPGSRGPDVSAQCE